VDRFSLKKLNEVECEEQCCAEALNRFEALQIVNTEVDNNSAYELKNNKPWFEEGCSKLINKRKQVSCTSYRIQT
jgi:hypothetical protein